MRKEKQPNEKQQRPPPKPEPVSGPAKSRGVAANKAGWEEDEE